MVQLDGREEAQVFLNATPSPLSCPPFQEERKLLFTSKGQNKIGNFRSLKSFKILWSCVLCHSMTVPGDVSVTCFQRDRHWCHPHGPSSCHRSGILFGKENDPCVLLPLTLGLTWHPRKSPSHLYVLGQVCLALLLPP